MRLTALNRGISDGISDRIGRKSADSKGAGLWLAVTLCLHSITNQIINNNTNKKSDQIPPHRQDRMAQNDRGFVTHFEQKTWGSDPLAPALVPVATADLHAQSRQILAGPALPWGRPVAPVYIDPFRRR